MNNMRKTIFFVFSLAFLLAFVSCSSNKKSGKVPFAKRAWHNMNLRYNGYYNARMRILSSFEVIETGYKDNYQQILAMYRYAAVDNVQAVASKLDEAIKKSTVAIETHRPADKWQDDAYMLIGTCEYLKKDYDRALNTFKYISTKFNPNKPMSLMTKAEKEQSRKQKAKEAQQKKKEKAKAAKEKAKAREKAQKQKKKAQKKKKAQQKKKKKSGAFKKPSDAKPKGDPKDPKDPKNANADPANPNGDADGGGKTKTEPEEKRKSYFLKHRPAFHDAQIWLARTHVELADYDAAEKILRDLEKDVNIPKRLMSEVFIVRSYRYIKEKDYVKAIEPLEKGIELTRNKKKKTRYLYILGQLQQELGNREMAAASYKRVLKGRPDFDMEFNARLNLATNGTGNTAQATVALNKMLKEEKNAEYLDQVYFALGMVAIEDRSTDVAIAHFKKSIQFNKNNPAQKGEAYYQLANIYLGREEYVAGVHYLDSTLTVLNKKDERYAMLEKRRNNLKDIAENLEVIQLQDSLLRVADMSPEEQKELAKKLKKEQAEAGGDKGPKGNGPLAGGAGGTGPNVNLAKSEFPLYNEKMKAKGERDFEKRWGKRSLVDNWRRVGKVDEEGNASPDNPGATEGEEIVFVTAKELDALLVDVPKTDEQKKQTHKRIADAMFLVGKLYRDRLGDNKKSKEMLVSLEQKYPGNANEEEALFYLYLIELEAGNSAAAESYKQQILQKFPKGKIAKSLVDGNFLTDAQKRLQRIDAWYKTAHANFEKREFALAYQQLSQTDSLFGKDHPFRAKVELLRAMCKGGVEGKDEYVKALKTVKTSFPGTDESKKAADMLKILTGQTDPEINPVGDNLAEKGKGNFVYAANAAHFVIVLLVNKNGNMEQAKAKITDYNGVFHSNDRLKASSFLLGAELPAVTVRKFTNATKAMDWIKGTAGKAEFLDPDTTPFELYAISQDNYTALVKDRNFEAYKAFYLANYGK